MQTIKTYIVSVLLLLSAQALSQPVISGESYIVISGSKFGSQKINFNKAEGNWFVNAKDAHGSITLRANYAGRPLQLDLEWDGKDAVHTITYELRHKQRMGEFLITMPDKDVYGDGFNAYPNDDQEIKIDITRSSDTALAADISGAVTEDNEVLNVTGHIRLKKPMTKAMTTGTYHDCDNVVYDKLTGAENRSPSECEVKFDLESRMAIAEAFRPVIELLQSKDWSVTKQTDPAPITGIKRGSEAYLYNVSYDVEMLLSGASAIVAGYKQQTDELNTELQQNYAAGKDNTALLAKYMALVKETQASTNINISIFGNGDGAELYSYRQGVKIGKLSNGAITLYAKSTSARTGGGEDNANAATLVLLGNWKQPVVEKNDVGGEEVSVVSTLSKTAPKLRTQNLVIRIECNNELAQEIISHIDFNKLYALLK